MVALKRFFAGLIFVLMAQGSRNAVVALKLRPAVLPGHPDGGSRNAVVALKPPPPTTCAGCWPGGSRNAVVALKPLRDWDAKKLCPHPGVPAGR